MFGCVSYWILCLLLCSRLSYCNSSVLLMNYQQSRVWRVLCWNVHGLNADARQRALRSKIEESRATIVCIQETKCEYIDHKFPRKFCPSALITLLTSLPRGLLVVCWFCGVPLHFMGKLSKLLMLVLWWISPLYIMVIAGRW